MGAGTAQGGGVRPFEASVVAGEGLFRDHTVQQLLPKK
jgi:hypothetical protein